MADPLFRFHGKLKLQLLLLVISLLFITRLSQAWMVAHIYENELWQREGNPSFQLEGWTMHPSKPINSKSAKSSTPRQPGSRPPQCHNECPGCQGDCVARPLYVSGSHGFSQHAVWSCTCVF